MQQRDQIAGLVMFMRNTCIVGYLIQHGTDTVWNMYLTPT